jgi:hypothetical protein
VAHPNRPPEDIADHERDENQPLDVETADFRGVSKNCPRPSLARSAGSGRRPQRIQQDARDVVCLAPLALEDHSAL